MKQNNGGPAFPQHGYESQDEKHWNSEDCGGAGLTLRDYFAAKAMQAWLSTYGDNDRHPATANNCAHVAEQAYQVADAMLAARDA